MRYFLMAGVRIKADTDLDEDRLFFPFSDFSCAEAEPDQTWSILPSDGSSPEELLKDYDNVSERASSDEVRVVSISGGFIILFLKFSFFRGVRLSADGRTAEFFCDDFRTDAALRISKDEKISGPVYEFLNGARFAYLYIAALRGRFALHSASVLLNDKALLLSAPSGTGKSTLAEHFEKALSCRIINGDLNVIYERDGAFFIGGTPWCGTSETYDNAEHPVSGLAFLSQGQENKVLPLPDFDMQVAFYQRLITPHWTEELCDRCLSFAERLCGDIILRRHIVKYECRDEDSAAEVLYRTITEG